MLVRIVIAVFIQWYEHIQGIYVRGFDIPKTMSTQFRFVRLATLCFFQASLACFVCVQFLPQIVSVTLVSYRTTGGLAKLS